MSLSFAKDVEKGLSSAPKFLSSKYFYDEEGSRIFQKIMGLNEYYLTRSEFEILSFHRKKLFDLIYDGRPFKLIELGAGDGMKVKLLLEEFVDRRAPFTYMPVDISREALNQLSDDLNRKLPKLKVEGICGDYFHAFKEFLPTEARQVVLFLGSNIGNLNDQETSALLQEIRSFLKKGDLMLIGFDLKKDPDIILKAYDDPWGVTKSFNLNLLKRMNRELEAQFDLEAFRHYATYDPATGFAESYLVSLKVQEVRVKKLETSFKFKQWEPIRTEISRKYDYASITKLASDAGFSVVRHLEDCKGYFADSLWTVD